MPKSRKHYAVDEHVGARVRSRRKALGMSQGTLAEQLGVTFQMIQRYEYGLCRISASTLYAAALTLDVSVAYFFNGLSMPAARPMEPSPQERSSLELAKTRYGRALADLFPRITHVGTRRAIVELVRAMVSEETQD